MIKHWEIFCDFDGTITYNDVGDVLFETFANSEYQRALKDWQAGRISSRRNLERVCAAARVTRTQLEQLCDSQKIDPTFSELVEYCRSRTYPLIVLSDGLDFYIKRILENYHFGYSEVRANHLCFVNTNRIVPQFPYWQHTCGACANCKGYHLRQSRKQGNYTIYIGDGLSDRCAVKEADVLFSKGELMEYCQRHQVHFFPYSNFNDIVQKLQELENRETQIN